MKNRETILKERIKLVRAMDEIARTINDEYIFQVWLECGVPDEEIDENTKDEHLIWLVEDDQEWQELLDLFNKIMYRAYKNGGLWAR